MVVDRRTRRRNRRSIGELDSPSRTRLRGLLDRSRLVVEPTSEIISLVESRIPPGAVGLAVACTDGLGVDQTIAVSEVLASRGHQVTAHLAARQIRTRRHLDETLQRLARRAITRILVVRGRTETSGAFETAGELLDAIHSHRDAPSEIGIVGHPGGIADIDRERLARRLLALATHATYVSTAATTPSPEQLLRWLAEMRVRGLELPVEAGVPSVFSRAGLVGERGSSRRSSAEWHDPTRFVAALAAQPVLDRLEVVGLRLETANEIERTAAWRQETYGLAHQVRTN